jgi:hypothetical protein
VLIYFVGLCGVLTEIGEGVEYCTTTVSKYMKYWHILLKVAGLEIVNMRVRKRHGTDFLGPNSTYEPHGAESFLRN